MRAKITHALQDDRDLRTSGNITATRAIRFADHVTKRTRMGLGDFNNVMYAMGQGQ